MKISLEWMSDYVDIGDDISVRQLVDDLTMKTVEVEEAITLGGRLQGVVVGEVAAPDGDARDSRPAVLPCRIGRLRSVEVEVPASMREPGTMVALAVGEDTRARVLSASDLGVETLFPVDAHAPIDLTRLTPQPGTPVAELLHWNDTILVIDNKSLTNRPDLWGHYGIAREVAAIYGLDLRRLPDNPLRARPATTLIGDVDGTLCDRITMTGIVRTGRMPASPMWLRSRLARVGQRSVNLYTDLTNYVMYSVGQPAHAYDAARVQRPLSVVRASHPVEAELLDGGMRVIQPGVPVIADAQGPRAIAGAVGDVESSVTSETTDVLVEMATFNPTVVRRTAQQLGIRTEASSRFEKGIDTQRADSARDLLLHLVEELDPDVAGVDWQDVTIAPTQSKRITLSLSFLSSRIGRGLSAGEVMDKLALLGFQSASQGDTLEVIAPTWRSTGDISLPHDLVEEVARLYGYETFGTDAPTIALTVPNARPVGWIERRVREHLALRAGIQEVVTYPWVANRSLTAAGLPTEGAVRFEGAPSPDRDTLRSSLVPNLLEVVAANARRVTPLRVFEVGTIFSRAPSGSGADPCNRPPLEQRAAAGALVGQDAVALFRDAQGAVEGLRRSCHLVSLETAPAVNAPWAHPVASAAVETAGEVIGTIAQVRDDVLGALGVRDLSVVCFELRLDSIAAFRTRQNLYVPSPGFPEVRFDLSFVVADHVRWSDVLAALDPAGDHVRQVAFVDQFQGASIPPGHKSLTARFTLGASDHTLGAAEIAAARADLIERLSTRLDARVRA